MQARLFAVALAACHGPSTPPSSTPTPAEPAPSRTSSPATRDDAGTMASLRALLSDPTRDPEGTTRARLAAELRGATDPAAVELLVEVLKQPPDKQPVVVHREAITSLGALRAASAVDAILLAIFSVPDAATTSSLGERAKVAVASIGSAAVPSIVSMIEGRNAAIERAVKDNDIPPDVVKQTGAMMLAGIRDPAGAAAVTRPRTRSPARPRSTPARARTRSRSSSRSRRAGCSPSPTPTCGPPPPCSRCGCPRRAAAPRARSPSVTCSSASTGRCPPRCSWPSSQLA